MLDVEIGVRHGGFVAASTTGNRASHMGGTESEWALAGKVATATVFPAMSKNSTE